MARAEIAIIGLLRSFRRDRCALDARGAGLETEETREREVSAKYLPSMPVSAYPVY